MPKRLKKPCAQPGCPELVEAGKAYCDEHKKKHRSYRDKEYKRDRKDSKEQKFYVSSAWRKLRKIKLNQDPLCEHCKEKGITREATDIDHIIPIKVDWSLRLSLDNLQSLCHSCHMKKSFEDRKKYNL